VGLLWDLWRRSAGRAPPSPPVTAIVVAATAGNQRSESLPSPNTLIRASRLSSIVILSSKDRGCTAFRLLMEPSRRRCSQRRSARAVPRSRMKATTVASSAKAGNRPKGPTSPSARTRRPSQGPRRPA
jgi:hypothetical protein